MTTLDTEPDTHSSRIRLGYLAVLLLAYLPPLWSQPGQVAADTKSYLYIDPARMLGRAAAMWDANIGFGTVTHQNIGYLFPMGPWYLAFERLGVPDWVAQRLWLGTIVAAAGFGVVYLARSLGVRGPGVAVSVLAYMFSPYSLHYAARISVLLGPWAALPWMLGLTARALRQPRAWYYPACFALVVQVVGGVNATALIFAGLGPVLFIAWEWLVARSVSWRDVGALVLRIGVLTLATSAWWIAGLSLQGAYGLDILRYTETVKAVARTSLPNEVLRGLGYWFFYGRDRLGSWIEAAPNYTQRPRIIFTSYLIPSLAMVSAGFVRWRRRGFFVVLTVVGVVIAVGAHPYARPTPLGAVFKAFANSSTAGLALRSTGRADPLVVLGLAMLLGAGVTAVTAWFTTRVHVRYAAVIPAVLAGALILSAFPALYDGTYYGRNLERADALPTYWQEAARYLDAQPHTTRVLELPGSDFASYRWGNTVDPITPGMMDRPYVARELIPYGSPPSADLLNAIDRRLQEGVFDPVGFVDLLRRAGIGTVVLRNDIQWERYNLIRPRELTFALRDVAGLHTEREFGPVVHESDAVGIVDERTLNPRIVATPDPRSVVVMKIDKPWPIVRSVPADAQHVVVDGDGEGVVDAAATGALAANGMVLSAPAFTKDPTALRRDAGPNAILVLTDQNRRRGRRWSTVLDNVGYTEYAGEQPLVPDVSDARLPVFPGAGDDASTVVVQQGVSRVQATAYGNPISFTPENRAAFAFDGNIETGWSVGAFDKVVGQRIEVVTSTPVTTDHVNLVQTLHGPRDRYITKVRLRFDGSQSLDVGLDPVSRVAAGQTIGFGRRSFRELSVEILATNQSDGPLYTGMSAVGFDEIRLVDSRTGTPVRVHEVTRLPLDMLRAFGPQSLSHPLVVSLTRERVREVPPRSDVEWAMDRSFSLPTARAFDLTGDVRVYPYALDPRRIDAAFGRSGPVTVWANEFLPDCLACRGAAALDGDPHTAWTTPVNNVQDQWIEVDRTTPFVLDHLDLSLVSDARHSLPSTLRVSLDGRNQDVVVPDLRPGPLGHVVTTRIPLAQVQGRHLRVTITGVRSKPTHSFYAGDAVLRLPVSVAELGVAHVQVAPLDSTPSGGHPGTFDTGCRSDLVRVDGVAVSVRISGPIAEALDGGPLHLSVCGPTRSVDMHAGVNEVTTVPGADSALSIDRLVLSSAAGGAPSSVARFVTAVPQPSPATVSSGRTDFTATVDGARSGSWLVLAQSFNPGWHASLGGHDLGPSTLTEGFANAWRLPTGSSTPAQVEIAWTPQRRVWLAFVVTGLGLVACAALLFKRRARSTAPAADAVRWISAAPADRSRRSIWVGALVVGVVGSAIAAPSVGLLAALAVIVALRWPRLQLVLRAAPGFLLLVVGTYVTQAQWRHHYPAVFEWPTLFEKILMVAWASVVLLLAIVVVDETGGVEPDVAEAGRVEP